ncbi:MAG TPA: AarF/ABC1/UbiB kinase family protein [Deltaproteobacteria bacterium]|nr:AarF/ABC1/UbiB kinase family protein [Deltaproteobacteria bacterium]
MKDDETREGMGLLKGFGIREDSGASFMTRFLKVLAPIDGGNPGVIVMRSRALRLLKEAKAEGVLDQTTRQMVLFTGIESFLPPSYAKFQPVVVEGIIFLISQLPLKRLAEKIVDQLGLSLSATPGERLFMLVSDMPSLQKLGQIICRSPGLDPQVKDSLTDLEDKIKTVTYGQLRPFLRKAIQSTSGEFTITPEKKILAEASVCAVVPAEVLSGEKGSPVSSVLKVVKPAVRRNLPAELLLLDRTVTFLDDNRSEWGLGDFSFQGTLSQVRRLLENEMDLTMEQGNLDKALSYHASDNAVLVPERSAASTPVMTVMSRLDGAKITDVAGLTPRERRRLAITLARLCIIRPIQDMNGESIFHGDPHAGNLAYTFEGQWPRIIFYDWTMLGRLGRLERLAMVLLTLGLIMDHGKVIFYAADVITKGSISVDKVMSGKIEGVIEEAMTGLKKGDRGILSTIEFLFEKFTYQGVVFSADLMMYEKALITLKGVLADIDPEFSRDDYLIRSAITTFMNDMIHLRLVKMVMEDIWSLYRHSFNLLIDVQKVIYRFFRDIALMRGKPPKIPLF